METSIAMPPPLELVVQTARVKLADGGEERVRALAQLPGLAWDDVARLARHHQTLQLLHHHLAALDIAPPEPHATAFRSYSRSVSLQNMLLVGYLKQVSEWFAEHGLRTISFKGPVLALKAYRSLGLRVCSDLDLLVRPGDLPRVGGILTGHGFMPGIKLQHFYGWRRRLMLYLSQQVTFVNRVNLTHLDVHVGLAPPLYAYPTDFDALYARGDDMALPGATVRTFSAEDTLVLLCLHGEKNRWEFLKYVCDIAALIASYPELDWARVAELSRRTHTRRIVLLGLAFASALLDAPIPASIQQEIRRDTDVLKLRDELLARLSTMSLEIADFEKRFWLHLHTQDTLRDRVRYLRVAALRAATEKLVA